MDAVNFLKVKERMCKEHDDSCSMTFYKEACPLYCDVGCQRFMKNNPYEAVSIVEKWSEEHPERTMLQDLLEKHPDTILKVDGTPLFVCPHYLGYGVRVEECSDSKCAECWNRPLSEN